MWRIRAAPGSDWGLTASPLAQIPLKTSSNGQVEVDECARLRDHQQGIPVGNLYALGLGFGFKSAHDGEDGRADGVGIYHKKAASIILSAVFGPRVGRLCSQCVLIGPWLFILYAHGPEPDGMHIGEARPLPQDRRASPLLPPQSCHAGLRGLQDVGGARGGVVRPAKEGARRDAGRGGTGPSPTPDPGC
jgi:hypothetical protein